VKPGGGILYWGHRGFWRGRSFSGDSERHVKGGSHGTSLSLLRLYDRNLKDSSYTNDPDSHVLKALEMGHLFLYGLHKGNLMASWPSVRL
jgi:hypothetical protein